MKTISGLPQSKKKKKDNSQENKEFYMNMFLVRKFIITKNFILQMLFYKKIG